jgi:hypothetical protein
MQSPQFLTYDEAREHLKQVDERRAKLRAECPPHLADVHARLFPPVSDEIFRLAMEKALLGVGKASRFRGALKSKAGGG